MFLIDPNNEMQEKLEILNTKLEDLDVLIENENSCKKRRKLYINRKSDLKYRMQKENRQKNLKEDLKNANEKLREL